MIYTNTRQDWTKLDQTRADKKGQDRIRHFYHVSFIDFYQCFYQCFYPLFQLFYQFLSTFSNFYQLSISHPNFSISFYFYQFLFLSFLFLSFLSLAFHPYARVPEGYEYVLYLVLVLHGSACVHGVHQILFKLSNAHQAVISARARARTCMCFKGWIGLCRYY